MAVLENVPPLYRKNDKKRPFSEFSFLTPYPNKGQELQVSEEQLLHALVPSEAGDPSELLENNESTR